MQSPGEPPSDRFAHLAGKVAVVTGSGSGIGRAIAVALAHAGARVVATSRSESSAHETAGMCGERCEAVGFDVTDADERRGLADRLGRAYGRPDVPSNAGLDLSHEPGIASSPTKVGRRTGDQPPSVFRLVRRSPLMKPGSSIVTIGSVNSFVARPAPPRTSRRRGPTPADRALAVDLAPSGVRANCVCPGTSPRRSRTASSQPHDRPDRWRPMLRMPR
jgi:NAD(P)-dependent dehydrogenase (short-subunit alcohol dehydrogenase family)